jgi:hypothetical protein
MCEKLIKPRQLKLADEAMQYFQRWQKSIEDDAMLNADNITKALAGRFETYAIKLAALLTIGRKTLMMVQR